MINKFILAATFLMFSAIQVKCLAQNTVFNQQDTLRGSITPERAWWDLIHYHLDIELDPQQKVIKGSNQITYRVIESKQTMQIDLQSPLRITRVLQENIELPFQSKGNAHFIQLPDEQEVGSLKKLTIQYEGKPHKAIRAPWDGGMTWSHDSEGNPFFATSCQGIGASIWWPCKDHMYDEPDSMTINVEVPQELVAVANGRLRNTEHNTQKKTKSYEWFVSNPIANYVVNVNVGNYAHFDEKYPGEKEALDMDYYVLKENLEKARVQFKDAARTLEAFEHWFGPYPFYEDGFKLVEVPYLGMEHQSSVTYGNGYINGYRGTDLSGTGWGLKFDFIIVHEVGHEWFANNITYSDIADMWIHESFTNYSESLFLEYHYGKEAGRSYVRGTRERIANDKPIIGIYGVNRRGSSDMYYKGGNMLNMLRSIIDDDQKWRMILRGLNKQFYHQVVETEDIENYITEHSGIDLSHFFDQYLRDDRIPALEYFFKDGQLHYRWSNCIPEFNMAVDISIDEKKMRIVPNTQWSTKPEEASNLKVDENFYVSTFQIK